MSEFDKRTTDSQQPTKPNLSRVQNHKKKNKNGLAAALLIVAIAFVALFPTFHYFIATNPTEKIEETTEKSSSKSSSSVSKETSKSSSQSSSVKQSTSSSSSSQSSQVTENNNTTQETTNNSSTYTVVAGDSLYSIAQNNGLTIDQLLQLNGLTAEASIYPGMSIKLK